MKRTSVGIPGAFAALAMASALVVLGGCRGGAEQRARDAGPMPDGNHDSPTVVDAPGGDRVDTGKPLKQNGDYCTAAADCVSGFCADGFCCNTACTDACYTCASVVGTCLPSDVGTNPRMLCQDQGEASCKHTGKCDGTGACENYAAGTICQDAGCVGSSLQSAGRCDGSGTCMGAASQSCAPFMCGANGQCRTTCTVDSDCVTPNTCVMGSCGKKPLGGTCGDGAECNSGFCAQGVCCSTACTGTCRSCALTGSAGTCTNVPAGQDPAMECTDAGMMSCGLDGACNGMGACRTYASGTVCGMTSCMNNAEMQAGRCNGTGMCAGGALTSCSPYVCSGTTACKTSCATDADCAAGFVCNGTICGKKPNGVVCTTAAECTSGYCEQGRCCNTGCSAACQSCALAGTLGTCTPIAAGMPPLVPASQCVASAASTCGNDGTCNGAGMCRQHAAGTVCAGATCTGSTLTPARTCDGAGICRPAGASSTCEPFQCGTGGACRTTCATNADCVAPNTCAMMSCGKKPNGAVCTAAAECNSGVCAQGVCCATACTGTCRSCALTGSAGTCANVPAGQLPTPASQCVDGGATSCGNDGTCNGNGACRNYVSGTQCAAATCPTGSTFTPPRLCNGMGMCAPATSSACSPYVCDTTANACRTTCTTDAHCASPNVCNGGTCSRKPLGRTCTAAAECASGFCAQGVCCATACTGTCQSCALATAPGTCTNVPSGTAPTPATQCMDAGATTCGTNGLCNGTGGCQLYTNGTVCAQGTCVNSTLTPARTCDGAGVCRTVTSSLCDPYGCDTTARVCKTMCATTADCASPNVCVGTSCGSRPNGSSCTAGSECNSGICAQGVCCSTACSGTCRSCALAASPGTCASVPAGQDPLNHCTAAAVSTCDDDGTCNGSGACRVYPSGTQCQPATCTGSTFTAASTCNGTGTCNTPAASSCSPYLCNTTTNACRTTCASNADCLGPNFVCVGTTCTSATMLTVQLAVDAAASVQWITTKFRITNNGTTAVPLSDLTLRYWFTYDTSPVVAQAGMCNYTFTPPGACSNVTNTWTAVTPARTNADFYSLVGFAGAAGNLNTGATAEFQVQFHKNDWLNYNQTNDYSFNGSTSFATTTRVTVYRAGTLVYGTEP